MGKRVKYHTGQSKESIAYLAGIIDGEGCFYIGRVKQGKYGNGYQWHAVLKVTNCDEELIIWLENTFGGAKQSRYRWTSKKAFTRPVYSWTASGPMLDYLIFLIYPYLIIKKKHCAIMGKYRNTCDNIGSKRLSDHTTELRTQYMTELRQLNSRWHNHPLKNPSPLSP
jgi:hypothetical protein